jgi:signal transduction histidine kinase
MRVARLPQGRVLPTAGWELRHRRPALPRWAQAGALPAVALLWRAWQRERAAAAETERLQRSILDSLRDGVVVYDAGGRITYANPAARELLGPAGGEPLDGEADPVAITAGTGEPCTGVDVALRRTDGELRWATVSTQALRDRPDAGPPFPVVAAFTDVTERRNALDALERSNAELAQFAYVASHDLSEPLRMVSSYLQLLRRRYHGRLDEDADEFIDYAVEGANRMRTLIADLLAYSRAGHGAEPRAVDLGQVMANVLSSLAAAIADARAHVHVEPMPRVLGDPVALAQVLQNLIGNALKFRRGPGVLVHVFAEPGEPGMWELSVADDGIGIEPRHRERAFQMFQRLQGAERFEGTGIGLAICRKLVERQGGRIWVEGREGGGSVFRFTLPTAPPPAEVPDEAGDRGEAPARDAALRA